jgi:hypothetical protein
MNTQNNNIGDKPLRVRRGRVDSVDLYEVKEHELEILENGEPTGIYLNFSIFLLSIALSCISALCTATFDKAIIENSFLFLSIIGILGGVFLIVLWWRGRKSIKLIIQKIKNRIPPEYIDQQSVEPETDNDEVIEDIDTKPNE